MPKIYDLNKLSLGQLPTPVHALEKLSKHFDNGPNIYIKRDDLTGLALGGNKVRKLEYIMQDALKQGCDTIITAGAAQSNHCRQTAAASAQQGLECHLVLGGEEPEISSGNLLLDKLFGAHIHWAGENRKGEDIPKIQEALEKKGKNPYQVSYGGSNHFGVCGFVNAMFELEEQLKQQSISHIVFGSSSGGTQAGMMIGKALLNQSYELIGINIDKDETFGIPFKDFVLNLANQANDFLETGQQTNVDDLILNDDYVGEGYGVVGQAEEEAIALTAQLEGILLDPVYTGRAMAGLIGMIRKGQLTADDNVLFWHTGGAPALFAN